MAHRFKQAGSYLALALISIACYGLLSYAVFAWLYRISILYAYLGNLALIIIVLAIDEYTQSYMRTEGFAARVKKEKNPEEFVRQVRRGLSSTGSFKADIYLFYVLILVFSQILSFSPSLAGEELSSFVLANDYSILVLLALDTLIGQFSKDRERIRQTMEQLEKVLAEPRD